MKSRLKVALLATLLSLLGFSVSLADPIAERLRELGAGFSRDGEGLIVLLHYPIDAEPADDSPIEPEIIAIASSLSSLRGIELRCRGLTVEHGVALSQLKEITSLTIRSRDLTDDVAKQLLRAPNLKRVSFTSNVITDETLSGVLPAATLESLRICSPRFLGIRLHALTDCKRLATLDLLGTSVGDDSLPALTEFPRLATLRLPQDVTVDGLSILLNAKQLREVYWRSGTKADAAAFIKTHVPHFQINHGR